MRFELTKGLPNGFAIRRLWPLSNPSKLVQAEGFEPSTHGLEDRCSIQLSYARSIVQAGLEPARLILSAIYHHRQHMMQYASSKGVRHHVYRFQH